MEHAKKTLLSRTGLTLLSLVTLAVSGLAFLHFTAQPAHSETVGASVKPMSVEVQTVGSELVRVWHEFSGRLAAVESVAIRPRVGGAITEILFEEGSRVAVSDPLFVIDPRPYRNELAAAKAEWTSATSRVQLAQQEIDRLEGLLKKKAISRSLYDSAENELKVATAAVTAAEVRIDQAKLNLDYAHIQAPVSGLISRAEITVGNLVEAGPGAPLLATIVANDKVYAEFEVDEQTYIKAVRANRQEALPVEIELAGTTYQGKIHAFDNRLDTRTGTIRARAIFDNEDGLLVPGMFATVRLGAAEETALILIPDSAVGTDQDKKFVYVVNESNQIDYRQVQLGQFLDGSREVLGGLKSGDRLLVNGLQRVRPGMPVNPVEQTQVARNVD